MRIDSIELRIVNFLSLKHKETKIYFFLLIVVTTLVEGILVAELRLIVLVIE